MSKQVITFKIAQFNLAVDIEYVDKLLFTIKKQSKRATSTLKYGDYTDKTTLYTAVELIDKAPVGSKSSMLLLHVADKTIPLAASSIGTLETIESMQQMPVYEDLGMSGLLDTAFIQNGQVHYLLNSIELSRRVELPPSTPIKSKTPEDNTPTFEVDPKSKNWLPYFLIITLNQQRSGSLSLTNGKTTADVGFTAGHVTYAKYKKSIAIDALKQISQADWDTCVWSEKEIGDPSNIDGTSDELMAEIKG